MRPLFTILALAAAALLTACSTPASRISSNQTAFDLYPPAVQQKIRAGQVGLGFTPAMVKLALGEPARQFTQKTETGEVGLWVYHDNGPSFSFGLGVGSAGRNSAVGVGVGASTGGYDPEEKMRVEFRDGKVSAVITVKSD